MQWNLIFEDATVSSYIEKLDSQQKSLLIASYLYRQIRLIKAFDSCYSENLEDLVVEALKTSLSEKKDSIIKIEHTINKSIPDTEEFSEQEGSYAQNLMIALDYFLLFLIDSDTSKLHKCIDMALQNIDLLNYEIDELYDEDEVTSNEVTVVLDLATKISNTKFSFGVSISELEKLVSSHML
ncbi:Uncharacterized protein ALO68_01315 [Pseudomonas syringae pv. helianthi]|uniref:Uncharacterized protein n=1 Tax=Pseudomonas syringae pv. helianthi TaxID=251654 RepID=A0A0P9RQW8_9PSED|nr:hypothetical protein [Pseudomonas syringae group genomosp. 7]KPX40968.1 Uncharacterized protein ALO68_01315 [Pseudomonas syringae pv. helianthi]UNB63041.1 hypothetical protein MME54_26305 [Pseudomonas syringae pv. helianthi]